MPNYPLEFINEVALPEFQEWTDKHGMMQDNDQGNTTGNGNLFTAHYVFGLEANGKLTDNERDRLNRVYLNNFRVPGLLMRDPSNGNGWQAHDDIVGMFAADAIINGPHRFLTKLVYDYGKKVQLDGTDETEPAEDYREKNRKIYKILNIVTFGRVRWVWNNQNPTKFHAASWLQRRMEMMATMQMSLRKWVNPVYWLVWAVTMLMLPIGWVNREYRDGYTLRFHSAIACEGYGPITNWICRRVRKAVARDYGDFGGLLSAYFGKPHHPIVALCKDKY
jgi:hypothetical protein